MQRLQTFEEFELKVLKEEVEKVLAAMEKMRGRRPQTRLEFFMWLGEYDPSSQKNSYDLESKLGASDFEHWIRGFKETDSKSVH